MLSGNQSKLYLSSLLLLLLELLLLLLLLTIHKVQTE